MLPLLASSFAALFYGDNLKMNISSDYYFISSIIFEIGGLILLAYIFLKEKISRQDIGFNFEKKDIWRFILLFISSYAILFLIAFSILMIYYFITGNFFTPELKNIFQVQVKLSVFYVIFILINPFFEELVMRGYLIIRLKNIGLSKYLAGLLSILVQTLYHSYQGFYGVFMV